jgi:transposase
MTGNCHVRFWSGGGSGDALAYRNTYRCPACGFVAHRDAVGCANILSTHYTGEPGHVLPAPQKYRYPFWGKRSRLDTAEVAWVPTGGAGRAQEAAPF